MTGAISGVVWGASAILFVDPNDLYITTFIIIILIGLVSSSVTPLSTHMPAFFAYSVPVLCCIAISFLLQPNKYFITLGILIVLYWAVLSWYAFVSGRSIHRTHELGLLNKLLVDQLGEKVLEAEHANHAKSKFLAAASHDLRQPLTAINLFTQALSNKKLDESSMELVNYISSSLASLEKLLDSLLDISKLDAGIIIPDHSPVDIRTMVHHIYAEFLPQAERKGTELRLFIGGDATIETDPSLLARILRNLVSNAIRHTSGGKILLSVRRRKDRLLLQVWDTGAGIAHADQHLIFEEFTQLNNPERDRDKGLGLGLAIVRRIAQLLGFDYGVRSVPGKGSVFWIEVPVQKYVTHTSEQHGTSSEDTDRLVSLPVLIIDDEAPIRQSLTAFLERYTSNILAAANVDEAITMLSDWSFTPRLIISDYRLPDHEKGTDAIRKIRDFYQDESLPAIIITGDIDATQLKDVSESGFPILHKPVKGDELIGEMSIILA